MGLINHSRIRSTRPWDVIVVLQDGRGKDHVGVFVEEREDGTIVLHCDNASVEYRSGEYRSWFLDDIQMSWYAAGQPGCDQWTLNVAKSRLPPTSSLRSRLLRIGEGGPHRFWDRFEDVLTNDERRVHTEPLRKFDGRERLAPELGPEVTEVCETIDSSTERITRREAGRVVLDITNALSQDGQVLTVTEKAVAPDGRSVEAVYVYDKD
jgi:hypothetical protein